MNWNDIGGIDWLGWLVIFVLWLFFLIYIGCICYVFGYLVAFMLL